MPKSSEVTYSDAIEKVMLKNGYFAPLKKLYQEIWKYKDFARIRGKTPEYTIQERVQRDPRFVRIGLGVYALRKYLDVLPEGVGSLRKGRVNSENTHTVMEGMLLEIGNSRNDVTHTYTSDRSRIFQNKTLGNLATLQRVPVFTYKAIIERSVQYADVIWFNERGFPIKIFEVEHSTDFRDAFVKFIDLQDFNTAFACVSDSRRKFKFERELDRPAFSGIKGKCVFYTYEQVSNDYDIATKKTTL